MASAPTTQSLVILGATGDLTARLLLPGLGGMLATGDVQGLEVIGSGLDDWDDERWRSRVRQSFADSGASGVELDRVVAETRYVRADATDATGSRMGQVEFLGADDSGRARFLHTGRAQPRVG